VIVLKEGRLLESGPPQDLLKEPTTEFAQIYDAYCRGVAF
jgi:ABC-type multidrug transport system fused ATPase/permease subunit